MRAALYVVSVSIGNLKDITIHALDVLKVADVILCEDTRKADVLLKSYAIEGKRLLVLNEYTSMRDVERYLELAKAGVVALISDAGTPLVCDPGFVIVNKARQVGVNVVVVTGACAVVAAAVLCGVNIVNCVFLGFFAKNIVFNVNLLNALYVAPHDVKALAGVLCKMEDDFVVEVKIAREVTKEYEEFVAFDSAKKMLEFYGENEARGEFTVFVGFTKKHSDVKSLVEGILSAMPSWRLIPRKELAKFLVERCDGLGDCSVKEVYACLNGL